MRREKKISRKPKRVFLVDPFSIIRVAVAGWLERTPDLMVCGQAEDAAEALKGIERTHPDIVLTEILDQKHLHFIKALHERYPRLPILVFSFGDEMHYAPQALEAGADGFLFKTVRAEKLVEGIRATLDGRMVLSSAMRYRLLSKFARRERMWRVPIWTRDRDRTARHAAPHRATARRWIGSE
jgi:DNA-binding NarL/FixJ family response regulator